MRKQRLTKTSAFSLQQFLPFMILIVIMIGLGACSNLVNVRQEELYNPQIDLHIEGSVNYENSPFSKSVERSLEANEHGIHILDVGDNALLARVHLIRNAKKSVYIQTFIWKYDESGRYVIKELIEAAKRGVKVYIIVDKFGLEDDPHLLAYFIDAHPNIQVKLYNPSADSVTPSTIRLIGEIAFKFKKFNQRMHNKIMVVDDQIAIVGGRNFQNDYFDKNRGRNFKDRDVIVVGGIVREMTDSFIRYWAFKWSVSAEDFIDVNRSVVNKEYLKHVNEKLFEFGGLFAHIDERSLDYDFIDQMFIKNMSFTSKIEFVYDEPGKNDKKSLKGGSTVARYVGELFSQAERQIILQTPYLVLDRKMMKQFKKIRKSNSNLDIRISTNSMASTDKVSAYAYSFKQRKKMMKQLKFRIFELKPQPEDMGLMMPEYDMKIIEEFTMGEKTAIGSMIDKLPLNEEKTWMCVHGKSFVIDDEIAWIGSFNLDPRSIHLNTEVGLVVWDKEISGKLKSNILRDIAPVNSWTVGKRRDIPVVSRFSSLIGTVVEMVPVVDIWPFQYSSLFQLKEGGEESPFYADKFYEHYGNVGSFPGVGLSTQRIQLRLIEALGGVGEPLI